MAYQDYYYWINKNERGEFSASVLDADITKTTKANEIFTIGQETLDDEDLENGCNPNYLVDAGYMDHNTDMVGLAKYLVEVGILEKGDRIIFLG